MPDFCSATLILTCGYVCMWLATSIYVDKQFGPWSAMSAVDPRAGNFYSVIGVQAILTAVFCFARLGFVMLAGALWPFTAAAIMRAW